MKTVHYVPVPSSLATECGVSISTCTRDGAWAFWNASPVRSTSGKAKTAAKDKLKEMLRDLDDGLPVAPDKTTI
jgi:hypothetical protein